MRTRISKATYGIFCHIPYDPTIPDHLKRASRAFMTVSGSKRIGDAFDIILPKVWFACIIELIYLNGVFRIPKCRRRRNSENRISGNRKLGMTSRTFRSLSGVTRVHRLSRRCGETCILVRILLCFVFLCPELWRPSRADRYFKIWTIKLDLSHINPFPLFKSDEEQGNYYRIDYDLVILFGLMTCLKAQLAWKDNVSSFSLHLLLVKAHMILLPVK